MLSVKDARFIRIFVKQSTFAKLQHFGDFIVLIAMLLGWGAPFTAVQLLFVNVVADGLPGFALGREPAEHGIMDQPPIPKNEGIFARGLLQKSP